MLTQGSLEFNIIFALTMVVIGIKYVLAMSLGRKVYLRTKHQGQFRADMLFMMGLYLFMAGTARILYSIFDFYYTQFDPAKYVANVWWWKTALVVAQVMLVGLLYTMDKRIYLFKWKGIPAYIIGITICIQFIYPINSMDDFEFVSSLFIITIGGSMLLPIMFIHLGSKKSELRKDSWRIGFGIILYSIGSAILMENLLGPLADQYTDMIRVYFYLISTICKAIGLFMVYLGSTTFKT